ncbi:hypothetical protein HMI54_003242 [Coelomomyces lativittatus]|nr:hypothetical protein HMI55_004145 [Coelomomyces lativittatus]KAJ1508417.1 hypothetical protein HMI54_003242 [Coelomomyces lativittatus]KAJ1512001.1 hypothetical protein HMI56_004656 [Coelomomyces lativittatus]
MSLFKAMEILVVTTVGVISGIYIFQPILEDLKSRSIQPSSSSTSTPSLQEKNKEECEFLHQPSTTV